MVNPSYLCPGQACEGKDQRRDNFDAVLLCKISERCKVVSVFWRVLLVLGCFRASQRHRVSARSLKRSPGARYPDHPVLRVARRTSEHTQQLVCRVAKLATSPLHSQDKETTFSEAEE